MVLDDVGRADTGVYAKSDIPTPNINALAKEGIILENFYTQTVCSPTRSSLLTGRYAFRFGMQHYTTQLPGMSAGVPLDVPMLPKLLKAAGYERHMVGKWHCGYATWGHTPMYRGFETFRGYFQAQGDYYKHTVSIPGGKALDGLDFWEGKEPMRAAVGNYSLDLYRAAVVRVVDGYASRQNTPEKQAAHPLFLYYAHQTVHIPLQYRSDDAKRCGHQKRQARRDYCNMLVELDDAVGELIGLLKSRGMYDNTFILTTTDNGGMTNWSGDKTTGYPVFPASQGSNYPLRGSKMTMFEGGVRSTAFVSGGYIPKDVRNTKYKGLAHVVDFAATILSAARVLPLNRESLKLDGHDLRGSMFFKFPDERTHVPINIVNGGKSYSAIRYAQWKLILNDNLNHAAQAWFDEQGELKKSPAPDEAKVLLFDLSADPKEEHDLSKDRPDILAYLSQFLESYVVGNDYMEPQSSSRVYASALPFLHGGVWKPFMSEADWTANFEKHRSNRNKVAAVGEGAETLVVE